MKTLEQAAESYAEDHSDSYVLEAMKQNVFKAGAEWQRKQPEKLTWEDAQRLWIISKQVMNELDSAKDTFPKWSSSSKEMFEEILKRFYEKKGDNK